MGLGINLVVNGTFDTNTTGWNPSGGAVLTSVGGELEVSGTGGSSPNGLQYIATETGEDYKITTDVRAGTGTAFSLRFGAWLANNSTAFGAPITFDYTAASTSTTLQLYNDYTDAGDNTIYWDNVFIQKVLPDPIVGTLSLGATGSTTQELTWTAANVNGGSAIAGYDIYKDGIIEKSVGNVLLDTVTGLTESTEYSWTIKARNSDDTAGESDFSNPVTATTEAGAATTTVEVEWIDSVSPGVTGHKIYRDDVEIGDVGMGVQTFDDVNAEFETTYKYEIQAYSATEETSIEVVNVNTITVTTPPELELPTGIVLTNI